MVTFIQLPSVVELDLERALDREFSEWFEAEINRQDDDNKAAASTLVKDLLIRGYLMTITARSAQQDSSEVKAVEDRRRVELERIVENACRAEAEKSRAEHMAQIDNSRNEVERYKAELERYRVELERSREESRVEGTRAMEEVQEMRVIHARLQDRIRALAVGDDERVRGIEERWRAEVERTAAQVAETAEALRREFEGRVALEVIRSTREMEDRTREAERFRLLYEQLAQRQKDDVVADRDACIAGLHEQLANMGAKVDALSRSNDVLSRSNAGKGNLGEDALMGCLRENFTDCEVLDASKIPCACDIHLVLPDTTTATTIIAVESKNKKVITNADITKFYRDVDNLIQQHEDAFLGAIFVSLATKNIPGKGDFRFESRAGRTLLFIATTTLRDASSSDIERDRDIAFLLKKAVPIIVQTYRPQRDHTSLSTAQDVKDKCNDIMRTEIDKATKRLSNIRDDVKKLRAAAAETHRVCERMQEEMGSIMEALMSALIDAAGVAGVNNTITPTTTTTSEAVEMMMPPLEHQTIIPTIPTKVQTKKTRRNKTARVGYS